MKNNSSKIWSKKEDCRQSEKSLRAIVLFNVNILEKVMFFGDFLDT